MVVLIILLVLILLIFFVPYGVDVSYEEKVFRLRIAGGPFRYQIFPQKPLTERQIEKARRKKEKKEKKAAAKKAEAEKKKEEQKKPEGPSDETVKVKKERRLTAETLAALLQLGLRALRRFFRSIRLDLFKLHLTLAGGDPCKLAMTYGYLCAALEGLPICADRGIDSLRRDIVIVPDFVSDKLEADARVVIRLQLFRIVHVAVAFGAEFLIWYIKHRRAEKAAAAEEREN